MHYYTNNPQNSIEAFQRCRWKDEVRLQWPGDVTLLGETLSGEIFVTKREIRHFRPTKNFAQKK